MESSKDTDSSLYHLQLQLDELCASNDETACESLLRELSSISEEDADGLFVHMCQMIHKKGHSEVIEDIMKALLARGADPNIDSDHLPLPPLIQMITEGHSHLMELFISYYADPNCRDKDGNRPLHYAVESGDRQMVSVLLLAGADKSLPNQDGRIPMDLCTDPIMQLLLQSSVPDIQGVVTLYDAIDDGDYERVKELIRHHPYSITTQLCFELSPLDYAKLRQHRFPRIYGLLLERSIHLQDENELKEASMFTHKRMDELLSMPIFTPEERIHYLEMRVQDRMKHHWWYGLSSQWQQFYIMVAILGGAVLIGGLSYMIQYSAVYAVGLLVVAPVLLVLVEHGVHYQPLQREINDPSFGWWPSGEEGIYDLVRGIEPTRGYSKQKQRELLLELMNYEHPTRMVLFDAITKHDSKIATLSPATIFLLRKIMARLHVMDISMKTRHQKDSEIQERHMRREANSPSIR